MIEQGIFWCHAWRSNWIWCTTYTINTP